MCDRKAARLLTVGLGPLWPRRGIVIADAGYESDALTEHLASHPGWRLRIVKRPRPSFEIVGPNRIVERTFAWLGRHRRLSKDHEFRVQTPETFITAAACTLMLERSAPSFQRALDAGCGEGRFCRMMKAHRVEVCGLDPTEALLKVQRATS
jgi:transposase